MIGKEINGSEPINGTEGYKGQMFPTEINTWTRVKNFLFQEIKVELTPKQEKVFREVHDFWHQEITVQSIKDFWFQEIEITL